MNTQYAKYVKFLRDTIVESGFAKSSGQPNIDAFYKHFSPALKGTGLSLSKSSFGGQVRGVENSPFGHTLEAMAVILSSARKEKVTVGFLDSLVNRRSLKEFEGMEESEIPDDDQAAIVRAGQILRLLQELPLNARASIAPKILESLAADWRYLDSPEYLRISQLLRAELERRGVGVEKFAELMLDVIPVDALRDIQAGRIPSTPLTSNQILVLQSNLRSIDGDDLHEDELQCLTHLDRPLT